MFGKKLYLMLALSLMLLLPAFALSGCGGSSGSSSAVTPGTSPSTSSTTTDLNATQLIEAYHCGGCHVNEQIGLMNGEGTEGLSSHGGASTGAAETDFSYMAWKALTEDNSIGGAGNGGGDAPGFANLLMEVQGAPMGGMDMMNNDWNGSIFPDYVVISMELQSLEGQWTGAAGTSSFSTVGAGASQRDFYPPQVTSVLPGDSLTGASYSLPIEITFSEPTNLTASNASNYITVKPAAGGSAVAGTFQVDPNYQDVVLFTPTSTLSKSTKYKVTVSGVTSLAGDLANGNALAGGGSVIAVPMTTAYSTTFTTAANAVADGNAIFFAANCAACHANYVDANGQIGLKELNGAIVKSPVDGPSLAEMGYMWDYAGGNDADFSTENLETAAAEMYPGSWASSPSSQPAYATTAGNTIGAFITNVGAGSAVDTDQVLLDPNGDINPTGDTGTQVGTAMQTTPILYGNATALADVAAYLETLEDANYSATTGASALSTNTGVSGKADGLALSAEQASARASSIITTEGCIMCHSVTSAVCPSGDHQIAVQGVATAVGAPDCETSAGKLADNTAVYTVNALANGEGAPDFDAAYDAAAGTNTAGATDTTSSPAVAGDPLATSGGGSTANIAVSEFITTGMAAQAGSGGSKNSIGQHGEGVPTLDYYAAITGTTDTLAASTAATTPFTSFENGDCTGDGVVKTSSGVTITDVAGNAVDTGIIDCSGTGAGNVSELGALVNFLRSIASE